MKQLTKLLLYSLLFFVALITIFPFIWLLSTSFKGAEEIFAFPPSLIPAHFNFENYEGVWNAVPFSQYLLNSVLVSFATVFFTLLLSSLAGYALARFKFKGKEILFLLVIASIMVPQEVLLIPLYTSILKLGLADTLIGVVLPFAVNGFAIFMMRQAFLSIPKEIEEAGIMDGCNHFKLWWKVMLPMTKPTLATLTIFTFISSWGDFIWPLVILKSPENYTLQVGLSYMMGTFVNNYRYIAAGAVLATIPVIIVFLLMQKHFERGLFAGASK
ncbi:MAG: carbohydrate ABC transporter permease [Ignavibacteria bacterium]|nr:carbohydrate ABC transporter permease [Ignavibacteria bacterium]